MLRHRIFDMGNFQPPADFACNRFVERFLLLRSAPAFQEYPLAVVHNPLLFEPSVRRIVRGKKAQARNVGDVEGAEKSLSDIIGEIILEKIDVFPC